MNERTPIRDLQGRKIANTLQRFHWRFETLQEDYTELMAVREPGPILDREHQFEQRGQLYEAERKLHHFLSGFYSYHSLVLTVANLCSDQDHVDRIMNERRQFDDLPSSRVVMGLRIFIQHQDILPLLVKISEHTDETPVYALNVDELQMGQGYHRGVDYHYGHIEKPYLLPFSQIHQDWPAVVALYEAVRDMINQFLGEDLRDYRSRLAELEEIRDEHVLPELRDMMDIDEGI